MTWRAMTIRRACLYQEQNGRDYWYCPSCNPVGAVHVIIALCWDTKARGRSTYWRANIGNAVEVGEGFGFRHGCPSPAYNTSKKEGRQRMQEEREHAGQDVW